MAFFLFNHDVAFCFYHLDYFQVWLDCYLRYRGSQFDLKAPGPLSWRRPVLFLNIGSVSFRVITEYTRSFLMLSKQIRHDITCNVRHLTQMKEET